MEHIGSLLNSPVIWGGVRWNFLTEEHLKNKKCLEQYGYKVYSQSDEDGIIQEIFRRIGTTNKVFIEFGVQDGLESNCHYLLFQEWKGLWLEGSEQSVKEINQKFHPVIENGQLQCKCAFVTKDNINTLISEAGLSGEIDLLSIDIDGNDYYIWEEIRVVKPRVVIIEYNGKFPPDCDWKMAYNENHIWDGSDWHGASLKSLELLGQSLGYQLVGTNLIGANAFFVRKDLTENLFYEPATAEELYNPLRTTIKHMNGHPARYCLKDQQSNLGLFNYFPDVIAMPGFGFYGLERNHDQQYGWISEINSQILIRGEIGRRKIKIPYFIEEKVLNRLNGSYPIVVEVDGGDEQTIQIVETKGYLEIMIPEIIRIIIVKITLPFLWKPSDLFGTQDDRCLGLAIIFSDIQDIS